MELDRAKPSLVLLGFDIRQHASTAPSFVSDAYRPSAGSKPLLSVDRHVTPSVFEFTDNACSMPQSKIVLPPMDWHQKKLHLWKEFKAMERAYFERVDSKDSQRHFPVAIALPDSEIAAWKEQWNGSVPAEWRLYQNPPEWELMGCDVANKDFASVVANDFHNLRKLPAFETYRHWIGRLNKYGIFSGLEDASEFSRFAGTNHLTEDSCFVYGIFKGPAPLQKHSKINSA